MIDKACAYKVNIDSSYIIPGGFVPIITKLIYKVVKMGFSIS